MVSSFKIKKRKISGSYIHCRFYASHFSEGKMIERFISILNEAIHMFYNNDRCLIERGGMEQACVSRIYYYLQDLMKYDTELNRYDLDCEYNKNGEEAKWCMDVDTGEKFKTRPDLILHKRATNHNNQVIIEFKGWWNNEYNSDVRKLKAFTNPDGIYRYQMGIFVKLNRDGPLYRYFKDSQEIEDLESFPARQSSGF